ncbi:MAG: hypothetical protein QXW47_09360 [Candidatus Jordarchaeales archaeon]
MEVVERFRSAEVAREISKEIRRLRPNRKVKFMHVCGTATGPEA